MTFAYRVTKHCFCDRVFSCSRRHARPWLRTLVHAILARQRRLLQASTLAERRRIVTVAYDQPLAMLVLRTVLAVTQEERRELDRESAHFRLHPEDIPF